MAEQMQLVEPAALVELAELSKAQAEAELTDSKRAASAVRAELAGLAVRLVSSEPARDVCMQHILRTASWVIIPPGRKILRLFPFKGGSTALHMLAFFGLSWLAKENLTFWGSIYQEDGYGNYPFKYAIMMGQNNMCHFLMSLSEGWSDGRPVFWSKSKDALSCAAALDWPLPLKRLLDCGLDPNAVTNAGTGTWATATRMATMRMTKMRTTMMMSMTARQPTNSTRIVSARHHPQHIQSSLHPSWSLS